MRRVTPLLAACLVAPLLMGQGCPTSVQDSTEPVFDRLASNDTLRAACAGYIEHDGAIEAYLFSLETDRVNGAQGWEQLNVVSAGCQNTPQAILPCISCGVALVKQVYGMP